MTRCQKAKNSTVERIFTIGFTSAVLYLTDPNPHNSFSNYVWKVSKYVIDNDKKALPEFITATCCWLGI